MGRVKQKLRRDRVLGDAGSVVEGTVHAAGGDPDWLTARRRSLGRHLYSLYRIYDSRVLQGLHAAGFGDIRPVHTDILRAIEVSGSRITDVAVRCNITKQAAGQVIKELVGLGYITVMTSPSDTRVRMVLFTEKGIGLILHLGGIFKRIDRRLAQIIGTNELSSFRANLERMIERLG